ncbi:MAG: glycosyltransferase family 4 protein [Acidimicrobiia bacterium]
MRIVVTGQADLRMLADLLDPTDALPIGMGGIPPVHEIRMLLTRGHDVTLVTLDPTITEELVLRGPALTVHVGPCRPKRAIRTLHRAERRYLSATIRALGPDVVHAHWTYEYALAALDTGIPTVVTVHDAPLRMVRWNLPRHGAGSPLRRLARTTHWILRASMAWRVARRSRLNIAVSPHTRDHFERIMRSPGEIETIPNLMAAESWLAIMAGAPTEWNPTQRPFRCVSVLGTWGDLKNSKTLLEAFARVLASGLDARLALVGVDFGTEGEAARWARVRNLTEGVEFVGPLTNRAVLDLLASADVLVHPSREEACGMVITEAQLVSTAVIGGSDSGGVPWTLGYGVAGVLVDIDSADQLADAIVAVARDHDRRHDLARSGHFLAVRRHEPETLITRIESVLQRAIDAPTTGPRPRTAR